MEMDVLYLAMKEPRSKIKNGSSGRTRAATISCRFILTQSFRLRLASEFEKLFRNLQIRLAFVLLKQECPIDRMTIEFVFPTLERVAFLTSDLLTVSRRRISLLTSFNAQMKLGKFSMSLCMLWVRFKFDKRKLTSRIDELFFANQGFWHEQQRGDRDDFVYVDRGNCLQSHFARDYYLLYTEKSIDRRIK